MINSLDELIGVYWGVETDELIFRTRDDSGKYFESSFDRLSDGQRGLLAMVGDMARRAAVLNPHLGENAPAETPGLVLIDELDLHLHPKWQRKVVDKLMEVFPKVQFVATTHSPFIIQSLYKREGTAIWDLTERKRVAPPTMSIEDIAEDTQGVEVPQRSERYNEMMKTAAEYFRLLKDASETGSGEADEIERKLDELSERYSDDVAYHAYLKMQRTAHGLGDE